MYFTVSPRSTLAEIADVLASDGYQSVGPSWRTTTELAALVRRAWRAGSLLWTAERLTSTDASRIDIRPDLDARGDSWNELELHGYTTAVAAYAGHMATCERWAAGWPEEGKACAK